MVGCSSLKLGMGGDIYLCVFINLLSQSDDKVRFIPLWMLPPFHSAKKLKIKLKWSAIQKNAPLAAVQNDSEKPHSRAQLIRYLY